MDCDPACLRRPPCPGTVTSTGHSQLWQQLPEGGGAAMAQDGALSTGQNRRHPSALVAQARVPDRIDAPMDAMQTA